MINHLGDARLVDYVSRSLTDAQREEMDIHLSTCQDCRARLDGHETLHRRARYSILDVRRQVGASSQATFSDIAPRLRRSRRIEMFVKHSSQFLYGAATIAVLVVLGIGLMTLFAEPTSTLIPPPTTAEFVLQFDGEPDRLQTPSSVAIDQQGNLYVYVADRNSEFRIQKFDRDGKLLTKWGATGFGDGQFYPDDSLHKGLSIDDQGNLYVTDGDNKRIQKFDSNGQFLTQWGEFRLVGRELTFPHDVAVDAQGNVYTVNCIQNQPFRVVKLDSNGNFLTEWDISESEWTGDGPSIYIAVGGDGNVYVSNDRVHLVQKFDSDGTLLGTIGGPGTGDGQFNRPGGLAVDRQGNLYVADVDNNRIQKFDSSGNFLFKWGSEGVGEGEFDRPADVTVDAQGNVYVVDVDNNRIQMFRQK